MPHVYRIETACGSGPFVGANGDYAYSEAVGVYPWRDPEHYPNPRHDGEEMEAAQDRHWHCAVRDIEGVLHWFPDPVGRLAMKEAGFQVTIYEVAEGHVEYGRKQVMFDPGGAVKVSTLDLLELERLVDGRQQLAVAA